MRLLACLGVSLNEMWAALEAVGGRRGRYGEEEGEAWTRKKKKNGPGLGLQPATPTGECLGLVTAAGSPSDRPSGQMRPVICMTTGQGTPYEYGIHGATSLVRACSKHRVESEYDQAGKQGTLRITDYVRSKYVVASTAWQTTEPRLLIPSTISLAVVPYRTVPACPMPLVLPTHSAPADVRLGSGCSPL